ncbi:5-amino-6-(5-phospho-D-ribitylamino)uracil phosphatase [Candidatus Hakubella thermalkaliphila]|uniref:5-amino-6-(5-phospho-D-ribitylamino)uracil phosphatase n=1 Tax=Candidatus Hakubella thermalkaliphila TaxID=2754717 RepID=A0A6V8Q0L8_9ACTN|nr:5-amino-6-(5-phospho-D-ribitylamino)uracil phosphatase [Candidatus Hakubella thermalkaliphila]
MKVNAVGDLAVFLETAPTKLTIINGEARLAEIKSALLERYGNELAIVISRPNFLEIADRLATKGQALSILAEMLDIPREQVAAVGDSYNDLDMILYAGFGVAVANAREEIKSVADIITAKNTDHGVAVFIRQYLFDEKEEIF